MEDDPDAIEQIAPESLLPYDTWTEEAMRHVVIRALKFVSQNGLPGEHHFYLTFRTDDPGTDIPARLKAQYPQEMTIVLQHQFWDLRVDAGSSYEELASANNGHITIGLSFGGVPSTLKIPVGAIVAFADPHIRFGVRFRYNAPTELDSKSVPGREQCTQPPVVAPPQVVSLDAFRRRPSLHES